MEAFRHSVVAPALPRVGTLVIVLRTIAPVPFGESVRSSFVPVVISVITPLKVNVPVVVIAPEAIVPIFTRLPEASILSVPDVAIEVVPFIVAPCIVPLAVMLVAPVIAPAFVIPPELLLSPPVIEAPPAVTVNPPDETVSKPPMV